MKRIKNQQVFFALVRAGLWELDVQLKPTSNIDYKELYQRAEEQAVVGLVTAGLEHVVDVKAPQGDVLTFIGTSLQLEQRNKEMNHFINDVVEKMRTAGIYTLLIKGQGIAQCYERPLWRAAGDVDFFLSKENYEKAVRFFSPLALKVEEENKKFLHFAMTIDPWLVELHGSMRTGLWKRFDMTIDDVQKSVFYEGNVRSWMNDKTQVFIPRANEDVVFVFSHILQHFFQEGIGLRQICDWCRLLWTYRETINRTLLEKHIRAMGCMSEWKAFAAFAVIKLGIPEEAMPFYSLNAKWERVANKIEWFILETGNFGHNRDYSYYEKYPYLLYKTISFWRHTKDCTRYFSMFPLDSIKVWWNMIITGVSVTANGR